MKRNIDNFFGSWKTETNRKPLLIRGARQIGKSYSVSEFGKQFETFIDINFEFDLKFRTAFETHKPSEIIQNISILTGKSIIPGKTLLFLDEIQAFPKAITTLRYFYEKMPALHVIAAGSLLEFTLESAGISFPVGRIQYYHMKPMTFFEFLTAAGNKQLCDFLETFKGGNINLAIHGKLMDSLKAYLLIGGMPEAVSAYLEQRDYQKCHQIQNAILETYHDDFNKYAKQSLHEPMQKIFLSAPKQIGGKFIFSKVDSEIRAARLKLGLKSLHKANVFHQIFWTNGNRLPFNASIKEKYFKVIMMDVGLMQNISGIDSDIIQEKDLLNVYRGALMEQFVGQELIGYSSPFTRPQLFYWGREAKNSNAEIDYVWQCKGQIFPIEVKSGTTGQLKSMRIFLKEKNKEWGIKVSSSPYTLEKPILSIPFYLLGQMERLVDKNILGKKF